ncbi:hypothetical protein B0H63DRAFT_3093 [Podospora didyma]|uniref:AB hydrolase-1 domain-containing protein n=1 Tax=Podospora didyma TaxID=330526 RepID=A0AAE0P3V7_9PEZI|nr:hypothetical protein B0H63DRAFT_3093 [Podospora didyma]
MFWNLPSSLLLIGTAITAAAAAAAIDPSAESLYSRCSDVSFKVSTTSQNVKFAFPPDPNNETQILEFNRRSLTLTGNPQNGTQLISGTFNIDGVYCRPPPTGVRARDDDVLEILVHGITYNKSLWSGLGLGARYDWHAGANARGYHTLAIDRLTHGTNPQHPEPLDVVQGQLHVEIVHEIIMAIRNNTRNNALDRGFSKIVYVGHSFGSQIGQTLGHLHPNDADVSVLTGYSAFPIITTFDNISFESAATFRPRHFHGQPLGNIVTPIEAQRTGAFYAGAFDPAVAHADFLAEDTVTIGEIAALITMISSGGGGYRKPVLVVTGVEDAIFCTPPAAVCASILAATKAIFPLASIYEFIMPESTGHTLSLHYSAPETLKGVHDFLDRVLR